VRYSQNDAGILKLQNRRLNEMLKVLMLGWELPPLISGGLGIACGGLFRALKHEGVDVTFVVPWTVQGSSYEFATVVGALGTVQSNEAAMVTSLQSYASSYGGNLYSENILEEATRFTEIATQIGQEKAFDIVHAHDWMTYRAGVSLQQALHKPLVVHVHSIEHDRVPGNPSPQICALEKEGLVAADQIIAVSRYTRQRIAENYGISPCGVKVIHNGIDKNTRFTTKLNPSEPRPKMVLFVGRLTAQKGPQYFLLAAKRVLQSNPDLRFLVVGDGDMRCHLEKMAEELGIADKVLFAGFLSQFDLSRVYTLASVCVMTSISEPFGLVALEAIQHGVPVIVPRHAGVTEVVRHCLRVDYWDIDKIAEDILAVVNNHSSLDEELARNAAREVAKLTWEKAAKKLITVYYRLCA
jgi:glycosyltransferase involved in cell wall biosynthesis